MNDYPKGLSSADYILAKALHRQRVLDEILKELSPKIDAMIADKVSLLRPHVRRMEVVHPPWFTK